MGSPKRKPGEDFEAFRKRRIKENKAMKERLKGTIVWESARIIQKPGGGVLELAKARTGGTYVRGVGKLKGSWSDKNKFDKLKEKAIRKRLLENGNEA